MTIHFRSRIQSPVNYSSFLFPGLSGCCCVGSSNQGSFPFTSTLGECNALGGYFTVASTCESVSCLPQGILGCCCACSYGGMTANVERTVCEDLDGTWQEGPCPLIAQQTAFCTSNGRDVRNKRACCGVTFSGGETFTYCEDVCLARECADNTVGNYIPKFYINGQQCTSIPPPDCSAIMGTEGLISGDSSTGRPEDDIYGNCCVQDNPCRCFESVTLSTCNRLNGSFYVLGETDYQCSECLANCTREEA